MRKELREKIIQLLGCKFKDETIFREYPRYIQETIADDIIDAILPFLEAKVITKDNKDGTYTHTFKPGE